MKKISAFLLALLFTLILLPSFGSADASGGQYDYVRVKLRPTMPRRFLYM